MMSLSYSAATGPRFAQQPRNSKASSSISTNTLITASSDNIHPSRGWESVMVKA